MTTGIRTTDYPPPPQDLPVSTIIIVACVCGFIVLVLLIILIVLCCRRHQLQPKYKEQSAALAATQNGAPSQTNGGLKPASALRGRDNLGMDDIAVIDERREPGVYVTQYAQYSPQHRQQPLHQPLGQSSPQQQQNTGYADPPPAYNGLAAPQQQQQHPPSQHAQANNYHSDPTWNNNAMKNELYSKQNELNDFRNSRPGGGSKRQYPEQFVESSSQLKSAKDNMEISGVSEQTKPKKVIHEVVV